MSSPTSSYNSSQRQQFRLRRKVPDGSDDFQRVLDTILSDEIDGYHDNDKENILEKEEDGRCSSSRYEDDFEHSDVEEIHVLNDDVQKNESRLHYRSKDDIHIHCKKNNYVHGINKTLSTDSAYEKETHKFREHHSLTNSPVPHSEITSPSCIHIFDCNGDLVYNSGGETDDIFSDRETRSRSKSSGVKLPLIHHKDHQTQTASAEAARGNMGANCSSGIYDQRDWHDIIGKDGVHKDKPRKKGKPFSKKQQLKLNSNKDGCGVMTSQLCTCKYRIADISPDQQDSEPITINGVNGIPDKSPTESEKGSIGSRLTDKSAPPVARSVSPNSGNRISRMLGLKKSASLSPKNDTSPHRLLVRRSYSPKSRASSMEEMIRQNNDSIYRQRSHSWSNGKLSSKPTTTTTNNKSNTTTSSTIIQSPILSPVANHTALVPTRLISPKDSSVKSEKQPQQDKVLPEIVTDNMVSNSAHEESCPLYKLSQDKGRLSPRDLQDDVDDSITPVSRRRAVSESQTMRSRQKARKAAANASLQAEQDLHVHWADEERGNSLSTSVFLSSIRPRSYSHGAESSMPQRPILKKVLIS